MPAHLTRFLFKRRALLQRFIFIRRPVLLRLNDFQIYVSLTDWAVGARVALKRGYEPHVTAAMRPLLQPGMVVVDIGANIGYYTLLAAARVGPSGQVLAFEPGSANCALLHRSLQANGFTHVTVHPYAVAEYDGPIEFSISNDNSNGKLGPGAPADPIYQVRAVDLDSFLQEEARIDLIKMDIEGAEGRALRGMQHIVTRHRPLIFSEFGPNFLKRVSGMAPEEYLDMLRAPGYELFVVQHSGGVTAEPQSNAQIFEHFAATPGLDHLDLLARPLPGDVAR